MSPVGSLPLIRVAAHSSIRDPQLQVTENSSDLLKCLDI